MYACRIGCVIIIYNNNIRTILILLKHLILIRQTSRGHLSLFTCKQWCVKWRKSNRMSVSPNTCIKNRIEFYIKLNTTAILRRHTGVLVRCNCCLPHMFKTSYFV